MRKRFISASVALLSLTFVGTAAAHFGMVIPSENIVTQDKKSVNVQLSFSHPFEMVGMDLVKPKKFMVYKDNKETDLLDSLEETKVMDHTGWQTTYQVERPGVYQFVMEPFPYWEPTEDVSIIHYTKTIVAAFGYDSGWDEPVGLPTEIVPLTRPFGNYGGNSFTGQVFMGGGAGSQCRGGGGTLQSRQCLHRTERIPCDPGCQGRWKRGLFLFMPAVRVVGICRPE